MKLSEKRALGQRYRPVLEVVMNMIDNPKTAYEKTLLDKCLQLLLKAKRAAMQDK